MASFEMTVGRLLCRQVRDFLKREQFKGKIEFLETGGLIERTFVIRGAPENVKPISDSLIRWANEQTK